MKSHGIPFQHRRPGSEPWVAKDYSEFLLFAAACAAAGVAEFVRGVFFDTKWQGFNLDVSPVHQNTAVHLAIEACAKQTLPQSALFDTVLHKDGTDLV